MSILFSDCDSHVASQLPPTKQKFDAGKLRQKKPSRPIDIHFTNTTVTKTKNETMWRNNHSHLYTHILNFNTSGFWILDSGVCNPLSIKFRDWACKKLRT
jgi:hypothetical protein